MDYPETGNVLFDRISVLSKSFINATFIPDLSFYAYSMWVNPWLEPQANRKKGEPELYRYNWNGSFTLFTLVRITLHTNNEDIGLVLLEKKLTLLKEVLEEANKEWRKRYAKPNTEGPLTRREWLNPETSAYGGYAAYDLTEDGQGSIRIADCQRVNTIYFNSKEFNSGMALKEVKDISELIAGVDKAIKAIHQTRKFFEREVFDK